MLILKNCENIDDFCLSRLYLFSDTLEFLDISGCSLVTDNGLGALYKLKWVKIHSPFSALWHNTMGTPLRFNFFKLTSLKYELPPNVQSNKLAASLKSEFPLNVKSNLMHHCSVSSFWIGSKKKNHCITKVLPKNLLHHWRVVLFLNSFIHKSRVKFTNG